MGLAEQHGGSLKPPEQTDVHTEDPLRLSGICRGFYNGLYLPRRRKRSPSHLVIPLASHTVVLTY